MWFDMRQETLGFAARAPVVQVSTADVRAPRATVFAAFTEPRSWAHWFPNVRDVSYAGAPPYGVGTVRRAQVGHTRWIEAMIVWDVGRRWGWTVTRASVPFATAQVESFEFLDAGSSTRVCWTLALEPRWLARLGAPFAPRIVSRLFQRAMDNLSTYLERLSAGADAPRSSS